MKRLESHAKCKRALEALSDSALIAAVARAAPLARGIGGTVCAMPVEGGEVFVKTVRLTALEQANPQSTANLFGLPLRYQYGLSSAGFGAWRELAAHQLTTGWVTSGAHPAFPLLHHWRVLPREPEENPALERQVAAWGGDLKIRNRLAAMEAATQSVVLFLERFPQDLRSLLIEGTPDWVEPALLDVTAFLSSKGFVHFDAHFQNLVTDGKALYLTDFGQALSEDFTLTPEEREFLNRHLQFDRTYVQAKLFAMTREPHLANAATQINRLFASLKA